METGTLSTAPGRPELIDSAGWPPPTPPLCQHGAPFTLARVRLTEFWDRMRAQFGEGYAESVAKDYVLSALGSRTVNQALADGEDAKAVWRAVCEAFRVPERLR